jgi:hypothetical protein
MHGFAADDCVVSACVFVSIVVVVVVAVAVAVAVAEAAAEAAAVAHKCVILSPSLAWMTFKNLFG